jgi:hypothetical protein
MLAPESTSNVVGKPLSRRDILAFFVDIRVGSLKGENFLFVAIA